MYAYFLDLSKAIDLVAYDVLFNKIMKASAPSEVDHRYHHTAALV